MEKQWCRRCWSGVDDDGDGDCAICARLSDEEAALLARTSPHNPDALKHMNASVARMAE